MSTYLELVNLAIQEAGKDQDDLTSSNFASPPDPRMYNRFKRWVNQSYQELQMARADWQFKSARAVTYIMPALYLTKGSRAAAPPVGTLLRGQDTEFVIEVQQIITTSGTWAGGDFVGTIYFTVPDGTLSSDFKFNEVFDEVDNTGAVLDTAVFTAKGWGRYDFLADGQVTDLQEVTVNTFKIQTTGGSTIQDNDPDVGRDDLEYVDWAVWNDRIDGLAGDRGKPMYVTTAPDGAFEFYPRPDRQYVVSFTYTLAELAMSAHGDTPTALPAKYHPILAWMAVRKSGMYDRDRTIVARADEHIRLYRNYLERTQMPFVSFGTSRYNHE